METTKKRRYKRYKKESTFTVSMGGNSFKAHISDFSIGGLSFSIEVTPITPGSLLDLKIEDLDLEVQGKVIWSKRVGSSIKVGVERLSISGNLRYFPFTDIILDLQRSEKTGILEISNGPICKKIYIKNGDMIFAESNHAYDNLGEILLRAGRITLEQFNRAADIMEKAGISDGKAYVELGYLNPKELPLRVMYQVEEIILNLFQWEFGNFRFIETPQASEEAQALKLSAANLIYKGIKRINNFTYIKNGCPSMDAILDYSADPMNLFQDMKLEEKEREILFLIDGKRTIEQILSLSPLDNFKTMQTLYGLLSARIIEVKEGGPTVDEIHKEALRKPEVEVDPLFAEKVEALNNRLNTTNYYDLLDIKKSATPDEIRVAYYRKTREFHPDKHFHQPSENMKNKLNTICSALTKAYKTLSDAEKKGKYDKGLSPEAEPAKAGISEPETEPAKPSALEPEIEPPKADIPEPEIKPAGPSTFKPKAEPAKPGTLKPEIEPEKPSSVEPKAEPPKPSTLEPKHAKPSKSEIIKEIFQKGKEALRKGSYTEAEGLFTKLIDLDSSVAVFHFCLTLALVLEKKFWEAQDSINKALELDPNNTDYMAELGYIYLELGLNAMAKETFEKVIQLDPSNKRGKNGLKKMGIHHQKM